LFVDYISSPGSDQEKKEKVAAGLKNRKKSNDIISTKNYFHFAFAVKIIIIVIFRSTTKDEEE